MLANVARWREQVGRPIVQGTTDPITTDDLTSCLAARGTTVETGDIILMRTGWMTWYRGLDADARADYASERMRPAPASPGSTCPPSSGTCTSPRSGPTTRPSSDPDEPRLLHVHFLPLLGLPLGELWDLDALADDCAAAGTYDAFFTSAPLNMPNGVASPTQRDRRPLTLTANWRQNLTYSDGG